MTLNNMPFFGKLKNFHQSLFLRFYKVEKKNTKKCIYGKGCFRRIKIYYNYISSHY